MNKLKDRNTINILLCTPLFAITFFTIIMIIVLNIYYGNNQYNITDNSLYNIFFCVSVIVFAILNLLGLICGLIYMIKNKKILLLWVINVLFCLFIIPFIK